MVRFLVLDRRGSSPDLIQLFKQEHEVHTYTDFASALDFVHSGGVYNVGVHYNFTTQRHVRQGADLESFPNTISHLQKVRQDWRPRWGQPPLELIVMPKPQHLYGGANKNFQRDFALAESYEAYVKRHRMSGVVFSDVLTFEVNLELGVQLWKNYFRWKNETGRHITPQQVTRLTSIEDPY